MSRSRKDSRTIRDDELAEQRFSSLLGRRKERKTTHRQVNADRDEYGRRHGDPRRNRHRRAA